jgi:hypothetical protein
MCSRLNDWLTIAVTALIALSRATALWWSTFSRIWTSIIQITREPTAAAAAVSMRASTGEEEIQTALGSITAMARANVNAPPLHPNAEAATAAGITKMMRSTACLFRNALTGVESKRA